MTDIIVKKTRICGTNITVYTAWEPSSLMGPHSTITTIEGRWYGKVDTRRPENLEGVPVGPERFRLVSEHYELQAERSYQAILIEYPETASGLRRSGEIEICAA